VHGSAVDTRHPADGVALPWPGGLWRGIDRIQSWGCRHSHVDEWWVLSKWLQSEVQQRRISELRAGHGREVPTRDSHRPDSGREAPA
jgi:hypothetical protein